MLAQHELEGGRNGSYSFEEGRLLSDVNLDQAEDRCDQTDDEDCLDEDCRRKVGSARATQGGMERQEMGRTEAKEGDLSS